jgi:hypothetical protein
MREAESSAWHDSVPPLRHCERSEAIQPAVRLWIA